MEPWEDWPKNWPEYHNANVDACDTKIGACACGATHVAGEFDFKDGKLFRYGQETVKRNGVYLEL